MKKCPLVAHHLPLTSARPERQGAFRCSLLSSPKDELQHFGFIFLGETSLTHPEVWPFLQIPPNVQNILLSLSNFIFLSLYPFRQELP
jgi:hypothetical protein